MRSNKTQAKGSALIPARVALAKTTRAELPKFVTLDEVTRACALLESKPRVRAYLRMLWLTGARRSEALAVRVADLDFRTKLVLLPTLKRRKPTTRTIPRPGAPRTSSYRSDESSRLGT